MKKIFIIIVCLLTFIGCSNNSSNMDNESNVEKEEANNDDINSNNTRVEDLLSNMTLDEKVAQLFVVDIYTFNKYNEVDTVTTGLRERLINFNVGGVIFFDGNIHDNEQVRTFTKEIQSNSKIPLFISVDEEGGKVSRLANNKNVKMTKIPTSSTIGKTNDPSKAYEVGKILGSELNALGFNMDFAPVADINTNSKNKVIGDRSFGSSPRLVADMVSNEIKGIQENKVAAVVKHFPGHGDTSFDTHKGAVYVKHNLERLKEIELIPFQKAIEEDVMGIMIAHINMPNITTEDLPASLSKDVIIELLRNKLEYDGLVITDALNMQAITNEYNSKDACVKAINAGVDVLLMPEDFDLAFEGVVSAVKNDEISISRINESVERILSVKERLGLLE
jgi:beta-N-acetylhexosaminidase